MVKISKFDKFTDELFSKNCFQKSLNSDNNKKYKRNIRIINNIIDDKLTQKQKKCLTMYYEKNMNTIKISKELNVQPSTVWRHINKAKNKIREILKYAIYQ